MSVPSVSARVGTSGYSYAFWRGSFYPEDLRDEDMLAFYATRFDTVEINNTFYRMPKRDVVRRWAEAVPEGFRFVIKASRRITHQARLRDCKDNLDYLASVLEPLEDKLGPVLFQCPPHLRKDLERLQGFVDVLPGSMQAVLEFRHPSWFDEDVYALLDRAGVVLCTADYAEEGEEEQACVFRPGDRGYLRLRGEAYDEASLARWAQKIATHWKTAYVFFKHEETAPMLASRLATMLAS